MLELFNPENPPSLYIHVPFCKTKCDYCSFYSVPLTPALSDLHKGYFKRLIAELNMCKNYFKKPFRTIYIGGGTPSLSENYEYISQILPLLEGSDELTLECNVSSLNKENLKLYSSFATRLSIGVQSFSSRTREFIGREDDIDNLYLLLELRNKSKAFPKINLDFIVCSKEDDDFMLDFDKFIKFCKKNSYKLPEHISLYMLTVEDNTIFSRAVESKKKQLMKDDRIASALQKYWDYLEKLGYRHYETSAFARKGAYCKHNVNYWKLGEYLALGPSGASRCFYKKQCEIIYENNVKKYATSFNSAQPFGDYEIIELSKKDIAVEMILTGFRTIWGVGIEDFNTRTGLDLLKLTSDIAGLERASGCIRVEKKYMIITESFIRKVCDRILDC